MEFHTYADGFKLYEKQFASRDALHARILRGSNDPISYGHIAFEQVWFRTNRPYYNVYPSIIPMLTKLKLDFPGQAIKPPQGYEALLLRFPKNKDHSLKIGDIPVRTVFMRFIQVRRTCGHRMLEPGIVIGYDIGEQLEGVPIFSLQIFPFDERNVMDVLGTIPNFVSPGVRATREEQEAVVRLVLTVCLIDKNKELLEPEILERDRLRYESLKDDEEAIALLVNRAARRGKNGFSLGRGIEVIPHTRRPHPAIYHTKSGPTVILRKGSIVHRDKVESVPSGHEHAK